MKPLPASFYEHKDVVRIARDLLGKTLVTLTDGKLTSGLIVETEAYSYCERGCHAYNNKMTERNKVMFEQGGVAYVYLCYGVHNLFNIVTNKAGKADAVLVRALQPLKGEETMLARMKTNSLKRITSGPGKLTKALGIDRKLNGASLLKSDLWIENGVKINKNEIVTASRIGIDYAGEDSKLPWRFYLKDNVWVSKE
ncbi:MAG TPA: DNA-3-methyladenine glycosylase [Cyclobacteriaceae bacterium]|mgnify:CR=1 FL=1|nr:DNA-3-methyladenine glycosylase [Cyclobacteriaceae bacterium]HPW63687.1 DNA-3-methyladenine glycosylase [Cyclobacteriaceae bacterium]